LKTANIAEFKSHLSEYIHFVEDGEQVQICKRNVAVALLTAVKKTVKNTTQLGCGKGSVKINGSLTDPVIDGMEWDMLRGDL